jgi:hypothetical protein
MDFAALAMVLALDPVGDLRELARAKGTPIYRSVQDRVLADYGGFDSFMLVLSVSLDDPGLPVRFRLDLHRRIGSMVDSPDQIRLAEMEARRLRQLQRPTATDENR